MTLRATNGQPPAGARSPPSCAIPRQISVFRPPRATSGQPLREGQSSGAGKLPLDTEPAREAVRIAYAYLDNEVPPGETASECFFPWSVERDTLGMVHVRLDRIHHGLKVFGEQIIVHLDPDGVVSGLTGDASNVLPRFDYTQLIGAGKALDIAEADFGLPPQGLSTSEMLIFRPPAREYRIAYRVELTNYDDGEHPLRMSYFVDARNGEVLDRYNLIDFWTPRGVTEAGAQMTWDFYRDILGRNSIDGNGERLVSCVHVRKRYDHTHWNGRQMQDDDVKQFSPLACLDMAGHELSHGLTERTAGLIYRGESGGLNEAMSDILGKGVQWYAARSNPAVKFSWGMGADIFALDRPGDALRYLDNPTRDGSSIDHYSHYPRQKEAYGCSGIANNAFFLMVVGGTNRTSGLRVECGIGMEKALRVMYRAEAYYMTPHTNFAGARQACLRAVADLHGADSAEAATVAQAWEAVGVQ